jgi:hypothetical protein
MTRGIPALYAPRGTTGPASGRGTTFAHKDTSRRSRVRQDVPRPSPPEGPHVRPPTRPLLAALMAALGPAGPARAAPAAGERIEISFSLTPSLP